MAQLKDVVIDSEESKAARLFFNVLIRLKQLDSTFYSDLNEQKDLEKFYEILKPLSKDIYTLMWEIHSDRVDTGGRIEVSMPLNRDSNDHSFTYRSIKISNLGNPVPDGNKYKDPIANIIYLWSDYKSSEEMLDDHSPDNIHRLFPKYRKVTDRVFYSFVPYTNGVESALDKYSNDNRTVVLEFMNNQQLESKIKIDFKV